MTFKVGDMVMIVAPPTGAHLSELPIVGRVGTVTGAFLPDRAHPMNGPYRGVTLADGQLVWATEVCLRLIPGDSEGRQTVDWNWRELVSKRPEIASA